MWCVVFESVPDLARHMNKWCPENNDLKRKREIEDEDIPSKKSRVNEIDIEGGEDMAFIKLAELAREANADIWEEKVDKYMDGDMNEDHAISKANRKLKDDDMGQFLSRYSSLVEYLLQLQNGKLHGKVMKMITELVNDGMDTVKAVKVAIRKYKPMLESYLDEAIENETNYDGSESENSIDDDEEEEEEEEEEAEDEDHESSAI